MSRALSTAPRPRPAARRRTPVAPTSRARDARRAAPAAPTARSIPARSSSSGASGVVPRRRVRGHAPRRCWPASAPPRPTARRSSRPTAGRSPTSSPSCAPIPPVAVRGAELRRPPRRRRLVAAVGVNDPEDRRQYSLDRMRVRDAWSRSDGRLEPRRGARHRRRGRPPGPRRARRARLRLRQRRHATQPTTTATARGWPGSSPPTPNDGYGIAGISWTDRILPVKIMNARAPATPPTCWRASSGPPTHGADVINMSVGGFPYSQYMQDAVRYAWNKGVVLVGAAGNNRREETYLPGELRQRHQRQRDAGRRRVQQLVELRAEGRRQRARAHRS